MENKSLFEQYQEKRIGLEGEKEDIVQNKKKFQRFMDEEAELQMNLNRFMERLVIEEPNAKTAEFLMESQEEIRRLSYKIVQESEWQMEQINEQYNEVEARIQKLDEDYVQEEKALKKESKEEKIWE